MLSSSDHIYKYDVFISFRGEDTRKTFAAQLHQALCKENVETFIDYNLRRGNDEVGPSLIEAIKQSRISIVVFSENYANSKSCLAELAQIMECRRFYDQIVIPVFYGVDPSNVRNQKGSYETAFTRYYTEAIQSLTFKDSLIEWKAALTQAANISGWDSSNYRDDSQLVNDIVKDVWKMLSLRYPNELKDFIENENNKQIESLFKKHQRIGIWGLAGMGKATIAKKIFAKHFAQYDSVCLLENVREDTERFGVSHIRNKLFDELLRRPTSASEIVGFHTFIKRSLSGKKVLIVLDDVDDTEQLEDLCSYLDELRSDSRLIITTSDKHLLDGRVDEIYKIEKWKFEESQKLFSLGAFKQIHVKKGYEGLSKRAVAYAGGIPLALKVLGLHFYSREPDFWDSELKHIENNGRDRAMTEGALQVMKASGVTITLNHKSVEENVRHELVTREKDSLAAKVAQLEGDLSKTREEHSTAITEKDNELKALQERVVTDQKTLSEIQGKVKDLEAAASDEDSRCEDERPDLQELDQAGLIAKLEVVEKVMRKMVRHGFESAVEQMKVMNPGVGLVIEGIHFLKSIEEGQLITPPDFEECVAMIEKADVKEAATEEVAPEDNYFLACVPFDVL